MARRTVGANIRSLWGKELADKGDALFNAMHEECLEWGPLCSVCQRLSDEGWDLHGQAAWYGEDRYGFAELVDVEETV